jgi:uncharacterized protein (TIGR01370 family)
MPRKSPITILIVLIFLAVACNLTAEEEAKPSPPPSPPEIQESSNTEAGQSSLTPKAAPAQAESPSAEVGQPSSESMMVDKWSLWVDGPHLRGVDLHPCKLFTVEDCAQPITRQDVQDLRDLGANLINASYPGLFTEEAPYVVNPIALAYLDNLIGWAEEVGLYIVIHFRTGPGRNEGAITLEGNPRFDVWRDQAAHAAWVEMWRFTAERYRDNPVVIGYDLMVEPHPNTLFDPNGELEPLELQAQVEGTLMDWNAFAAEITAAIRQVDPDTPIIVNSLSWASAEWFSALRPTGDSRTVYSLHAYDPDVYVIQDEGNLTISYPDVVEDYGENITFDRAWLDENYRPVREFVQQHDVPIYVGEFGAVRWVPGATEFLYDQTDLFEQYGWNYAIYVWRGDEPYFDGFNLEYGPDPENHAPILDNPLLSILRDRWTKNIDFPGSSLVGVESAGSEAEGIPTAPDTGLPTLADVRHWLYLIDVNLELETVNQIVASEHDMVVLDFIPFEANNTDYPMAEVVERLHNAPRPKLAIAYIDIGQAEDFRTYWQPGWRIGQPEWIVGGDPDGWAGNYPVAYWYEEWREIWLGPDGVLQAILDAGFDGIYLDWLEAYSDENVMAFAQSDGADARQEMIWWVGDMAEFTRAQRPDFIVIGQNAAELAVFDEYVNVIDAISQEQVWFDGAADNDPPGDCPLPRTEAEVETEAYVAGLSEPCRMMYEEFPDSTLHVSSEAYLQDLALAQSKGLVIFTVDYALEPGNVAWIYETSRGLGFVPFVGNRALDRYVAPVLETETDVDVVEDVTVVGNNWWQPAMNTTWQWQLDQPIDPSFDVDMYDIDLFESEASMVDALHAQGRKVVCYISVGSWEDWRPDQDQFPSSVIGQDYEGWPGEKWLDIRQIELLAPMMRARLDECQAKGFDGVEPDNIDGYTNDTGFPLTYQDQLDFNIWLANEAHTRGLSIGLKNDPDQVPDLLPYFDWALTEDCFAEGWCEQMLPFIEAGKPVFAAEYTDTGITTEQFCARAQEMNISAILKNRDLDAWREACR